MARNKYDIDETLETEFNFNHLKRLYGYIKPHRKEFIIVIAIMISVSMLSTLTPRLFMVVMDKYIPNKNISGLLFICGIILSINLYVFFILRFRIKMTATIGQKVIHQLRSDLFNHLQKLPFSYYDDRPHGKIQVRVVNYVNSLSDLLSNGIINTVTELFNLIFIIIFMLSINVKLTLVCLSGLPIFMLVIFAIKKKQRVSWQISSNKSSNLNAYIAESINGIRVTQSFVRERKNADIFNTLSGSYRKAWMTAVKYIFLLSPSIDIISVFTVSAIYVLGIHYIVAGDTLITAGVIIAFTSYLGRFWNPITVMASFYSNVINAVSYLERIYETIDEPLIVQDTEDAYDMPSINGCVEFKDVCFSYDNNVKILDNVNFKAEIGESFAIVGPTGAGKTTIINLISRFYNLDSGEILIDGIDISKVTIKSIRTQMGVMLQDSFIFSGTIMDNIRYGNMAATDEEVIIAAKTVCAHDFIINMENGYETEVNERGSRLSQGQRQLISFARALLANPKILILDEATSSIDTETEIALQKGLSELLLGRTSFIIAHRLSTIKNSSCILYVDKGHIIEMGTHDELIDCRGEYYRLYMSQYSFLNPDYLYRVNE